MIGYYITKQIRVKANGNSADARVGRDPRHRGRTHITFQTSATLGRIPPNKILRVSLNYRNKL